MAGDRVGPCGPPIVGGGVGQTNWAFELSYCRLSSASTINDNQVDPRFLTLGSLLTQPVTGAAAVAAGIERPYPSFNGSVNQALRPYPLYLAVTEQPAKAVLGGLHAATRTA